MSKDPSSPADAGTESRHSSCGCQAKRSDFTSPAVQQFRRGRRGHDSLVPLYIASLHAWFSVRPGQIWAERNGSRVTPSTPGGVVGEVASMGAGNYYMRADSDSARALWKPSKRSLLFDGSNDCYTHNGSVGASAAYTFIFRGQATSATGNRAVVWAHRALLYASRSGNGKWGTYQNADLATAHNSTGDDVVAVVCRANNDIDIYVNGSKTTFTTGSSHGYNYASVGGAAGSEFFAGYMRDLAIYTRALTLGEVGRVSRYFRNF